MESLADINYNDNDNRNNLSDLFLFYRKKEKGKRINPFSLFLLALVKEMLQR